MDVAEQWARIIAWCSENAPVTAGAIRPSAGAAAVLVAETATGVVWPAELRELYLLQNGAPSHRDDHYLGGAIPGHRMLSLDDAISDRAMMLKVWAELIDGGLNGFEKATSADRESEPAGTPTFMFVPSFIPFASLDDCHYFVDARPGPRHGCVTEYAHEEADGRGPDWDSISEMLAALASSLENGTEFLWWRPVVADGVLDWEI